MGVVGWGMMGPGNTKSFLSESDCQVVAACDLDKDHLQKALDTINEQYGNKDCKGYHDYRELLARTPVDELEVRSQPRVIFRVDEVTWLDAIVRYLVPPREAGAVKTRLIPKLLAALNDQPERVMFPKGDAR